MPITISTGLMKYRNQNGTYEDINAVSYEAGVATHICSSSEYNATTRIPTVQNPEENIFYLVPAENGTSPDMFVEWIYANNAWERFGNVTLDIPVEDVQVNGTSIVNNGVANVPIASSSNFGIVKTSNAYGTAVLPEGTIKLEQASSAQVKAGTQGYKPIVPERQHESTFYGLAKAAGDSTQSSSNNAVGTYTDEAKSAIQTMLDVPANDDVLIKSPTFGTPEVIVDTTTLSFHKDGDNEWYCTDEDPIQDFTKTTIVYDCVYKVEWDGVEYAEELAVSYSKQSDTGWYEWTGIGNVDFLGNSTNYASTAPFVVAYDYHRNSAEVQIFTEDTSASHTIKITKVPFVKTENKEQFYNDVHNNIPLIRKGTGLYSTIIGEAINASGEASFAEGGATIASGNYSHAEGSSSIASGKYAHAEGARSKASGGRSHAEGFGSTASGLTSHTEGYQTTASGANSHAEGDKTVASGACSHAEGEISTASNDTAHAEGYRTLASGVDSHVEGEYSIASGNITHAEGYNTIAAGACSHVHGKSNVADSYESLPEWVANTEYAVGDKVKVTTTSNNITTVKGYSCKIANNDSVFDSSKWNANPILNYVEIVGNGTSANARSNAYALTWTGDGKYAGHVYVGTNADSSGGTMLPEDIQVNGTSVVSNGLANIPIASNNIYGVVQTQDNLGIVINGNGKISINSANSTHIKAGTSGYLPIVPGTLNSAVFYGLSRAAGVSMASSDNAVGTYTTEAKAAIHTMLGIDPASIAAQVEIPLIETVSGTTPSITGQPNTRYNCGEVSTISITPPVSGSIDVFFESGSTAAVLTVPNTVKWPEWFDASSLEANTVYEILITDGVYGSVMTWAA